MFSTYILVILGVIFALLGVGGYLIFGTPFHLFFVLWGLLSIFPIIFLGKQYLFSKIPKKTIRKRDIFSMILFFSTVFVSILFLKLPLFIGIVGLLFLATIFFLKSTKILFCTTLFFLILCPVFSFFDQIMLLKVSALSVFYGSVGILVAEILTPLWDRFLTKIIPTNSFISGWSEYSEAIKHYLDWLGNFVFLVLMIILLQYLFRSYLPIVFYPTPMGVGILSGIYIIAILFSQNKIFQIPQKFSFLNVTLVVCGILLICGYLGEYPAINTLFYKFLFILLFLGIIFGNKIIEIMFKNFVKKDISI